MYKKEKEKSTSWRLIFESIIKKKTDITMSTTAHDEERSRAVAAYTQALRSSREIEARAKARREILREARKKFDKSEDDITALQSVGQQIGEVLKQLDDERFIIKASSGPRYVVGVRRKVSHCLLTFFHTRHESNFFFLPLFFI